MVRGLTPTNIEWVAHKDGSKGFSWNVLTGCLNNCEYCYARKLVDTRLKGHPRYNPGFFPKFNEDILDAPLRRQKPSKIFVCSMGELWGSGVYNHWRDPVLKVMRLAKQHTFLNLTKNPNRVIAYTEEQDLPENMWIGVSVDTLEGTKRIPELFQVRHPHKFISFEPLMANVAMSEYFSLEDVGWVIIGALSKGPGVKVQPDPKWTANIINEAMKLGIPIFMKDNMRWAPGKEAYREFPEGFP